METSATRVLKSSRPVVWAPDIPRSRSRTRISGSFQPNSPRFLSQGILTIGALLMVANLRQRRLTHIHVGGFAPVMFGDLGIHQPPPQGMKSLRCCRASLRAYWRATHHRTPHRSGRGGELVIASCRFFREPLDGVAVRD